MTTAVLAEKPAVARDLARVLGAGQRGQGFLHGGGYVVTWAIGHLVALSEPHQIDPAWRRWRLDLLPMTPSRWPLAVLEQTRAQFEVVRRILSDSKVERVVCATDAGREGELIFRYIYEAAGCTKPVGRLWISSLTESAIRDGFRRIKPGRDYDGLADAARGRSRADWLVGMNLSRAYSLTLGQDFSVGRVQTPTLAIVVDRELAIRAFVPEDYLEVEATFSPERPGEAKETYRGTYFRTPLAQEKAQKEDRDKLSRLPPDGEEAARIIERARKGDASIANVKAETRRIPPPLLYDLTELQRHANRLFGYSAQRTLDLAQALYERHKLISYPRTDSRHLTKDVEKTLGSIVKAIEGPYQHLLAPGTGQRPLGGRFIDDAKVTDHHAIIPTGAKPPSSLGEGEQRIYDLICRRLLSAWHADHIYSVTTVITVIKTPSPEGPIVDPYRTTGTAVEQIGWKALDLNAARKKAPTEHDQALPSALTAGQRARVLDACAVQKQTRPPPRFTEATLLTAMETAGQTLEEKELSLAMKDTGLGTPATRAAIIETLLKRDYLIRDGKLLEATDKGIALITVVHPDVKSPAMTGEWEARLKRVQRGELTLPTFMSAIETYVRDVVAKVTTHPPAPAVTTGPLPDGRGTRTPASPRRSQRPEVTNSRAQPEAPAHALPCRPIHATEAATLDLPTILHDAFGFSSFRPYQEAVCRAAVAGRDLLLVMPTGAGKSLCYQLPGVARGGTTLVISPLIALMEDQVAKLKHQHFAAERIHSGRDRKDSRAACVDYLEGRLDFLFIAPERLRVPGFPEMLAKRRPTLIAVDEAHCISHWGHDFRPDYRMLGERLPLLRPAPILALTATATPLVQDDIITELGLHDAARFIHGFRRTNLAIEVIELAPSERGQRTRELLRERGRTPAIVYAPTRKEAEATAALLAEDFTAAAYHAGMDAEARDRIQVAFLSGKLSVIVATIAFGMGIDKADVRTIVHTALPGSLEAYYQEIGRAGRDGELSRVVLMYSFVDRKTHEFFHERDYPEPAVLASIWNALSAKPRTREGLQQKLGIDPNTFDKSLEKLWIHGGARVEPDGSVLRGEPGWERPYAAQRRHKLEQLALMGRFTEGHGCRMVALVRHFGDQEDGGEPCGLCDVCAPDRCLIRRFRPPSRTESTAITRILTALAHGGDQPTGRLHRETFSDGSLDRRSFEHLLGGLSRAGLVRVTEASFEKDGATVSFQRASLTMRGRRWDDSSDMDFGGEIVLAEGRAAKEPKAAKDRDKSKRAFFARKAAIAKAKKGRRPRR